MSRINDRELEKYLSQWRNDDSFGFSDINLFLDKGYLELAAITLLEADALTPNFEEADDPRLAKAAYKLGKSVSRRKRDKLIAEVLKNTEIWHGLYNETLFVPRIDIDYFVSAETLNKAGYSFEHGYDENGKEYNETRLKY